MAPQQRTFTIVPNPLGMQGLVQRTAGEGVPAHRPMTSKQAQKLHRQATRLPKRTKAEQAKYEAEQRRLIKEEDEKRRASNKARMLRDKKKEREQKIIESKKRKGLPIVDVRPSQDLITRFVRGNGTKKKRDVAGAALDTLREESLTCDSATETAAEEDEYSPGEGESEETSQAEAPTDLPERSLKPAKRLRTEPDDAGNPSSLATQSPHQRSQRANRTAVSAIRMLDAKSRESSFDVDDPIVEDLLRTQILADSASAANSSAVQQRSPAHSPDIVPSPQLAPGKENIPLLSTALSRSKRSVERSPSRQPKSATQPRSQSKQAPEGQRPLASKSQGRQAAKSQGSSAPAAPSKLAARHSLPKPPRGYASEQRSPSQHSRTIVREPSRYMTYSVEGMKPRVPIKAAVGNYQRPVGHGMQRECPEPCTSRATATRAGSSSKSQSVNPTLKPRPLQESSFGAPEPVANSPGSSIAVKRPPPVKPALQAPSAPGEHAMPPPPPPAGGFKKSPQANTRRKLLPKHLQTPIPPRLPSVEARRKPAAGVGSLAGESALPSSTQLFVLSHLDDILPSPSQELLELEETAPRPPPISRPRPPARESAPRFQARTMQSVGTTNATPVIEPRALRPRQPISAAPPALPVGQAVEPALPFFSTQDLMLSSQDIRDLEDMSETPSKLPDQKTQCKTSHTATASAGKEPALEAWKRPVDLFIHPGKSRRMAQDRSQPCAATEESRRLPQFSQAPQYAARKSRPQTPMCSSDQSARASQPREPPSQVRCLDPEPSNRALSHIPAASQRIVRSSPRTRATHRQRPAPTPPKPSAAGQGREYLAIREPVQAHHDQQPDPGHKLSPPPETLKTSGSPQKGRFFTASNEELQLALEKSLRTHREEQRKREAEEWALELRWREEEEQRQREAVRRVRELRRRGGSMFEDDAALRAGEGGKCEEERSGRQNGQGEKQSGDLHIRLPRTSEDDPRRDEQVMDRGEREQDVSPGCSTKHRQHTADRQVSQDPRALADEDLEAFDLDQDLEQALLRAEYDVAGVRTPVPKLSEHGHEGMRLGPRLAASQETDYGDLDVTVEDLDEYL